jgi:phosphoglycolate phosphatase-like HAD superfamily hydrolase
VGDEAADVTLARSAGARSAIVTHTLSQEQARAAGADHVLPRIEDLLPLCARP